MSMTSSQVFISYAEQDKTHAEKLCNRLKQEGIAVWYIEESLLPGQNCEIHIREAIQSSRLFIPLLSSASVQRGISNKRLKQALEVLEEFSDNEIFIIPVRIDDCDPSHEKLRAIHRVDLFPDWEKGFHKIVETIRKVILNGTCADDPAFIQNLFDLFGSKQAVMLLAQEGRNDMTQTLKEEAERRFGKNNVRHLVPPSGAALSLEDYFSAMARQFQKQATSEVSFMSVIEELLAEGKKLFLLITRFEQGNEAGNGRLAGALRSLLERFHHLNILICGGEKLADQFFGGELSLLNTSEVREMPEISLADVQCRCPDKPFAENILQISGGHPRLMEECVTICRNNGFKENDCREHLMNAYSVMKLFTPFRESPDRQRICRLLQSMEVGQYGVPDIFDPLIKTLYWKNLLKKSPDGKRLVWRCELLREMGRRVLE